MRYTAHELMAIVAAREIHDDEIIFCGTGISLLAAMAAKRIHAPRAIIFFETGAIDPDLREIPLAVADPRVMYGTSVNAGLADAFGMMQNRFLGPRMVGILGAAQIDRYGNLNSTCIGDYAQPTVRFPGSGGACDVGSFVGRIIVFIQHERKRFVERLDYLTTPGYLDGAGGRKREPPASRHRRLVAETGQIDEDAGHELVVQSAPHERFVARPTAFVHLAVEDPVLLVQEDPGVRALLAALGEGIVEALAKAFGG